MMNFKVRHKHHRPRVFALITICKCRCRSSANENTPKKSISRRKKIPRTHSFLFIFHHVISQSPNERSSLICSVAPIFCGACMQINDNEVLVAPLKKKSTCHVTVVAH
jgi:hypothetical protein